MAERSSGLLDEAAGHIGSGRYAEAGKAMEAFFSEAKGKDIDKGLLARGHLVAARALAYTSSHADAVKHCLEALRISDEMKDVAAQADTMRWLGHIHWQRGDPHMAMEYLEEGLRRAKKAGDKRLEGIIEIEISNAADALGDQDGAMSHVRLAIGLLEPVGDRMELARAYNNLADSLVQLSEWAKAADLFKKTKAIATDDVDMRAWGGFGLAECLLEMGRLDEAMQELDEAVPVVERSGDKLGLMSAYRIMGLVHARRGKWAEGKEVLSRAREMARELAVPQFEGKIVRDMGRLYALKGERPNARRFLNEARDIFKGIGAKHDLALVEKVLKGLG